MENYDNVSEMDNDNSKRSKKKVILLGIIGVVALLIIIILFTIVIPNYKRNQAAKESLNTINSEIDNQKYAQAFNDLSSFKTEYDFGKYPSEADKSLKVLNELADKAKQDGLKILNNDSSEYFEDTYKYFKDYTVNYSYDKKIGQVSDLLQLIDDYKKKADDLSAASDTLKWFDSNKKLIGYMEGYINDVDTIHRVADDCINNKKYNLSDTLYKDWDSNSEFYYGIVDDIKKLSDSDLNNTLMTTEEYDKFKNLIIYGLLPAETYYQSMNGVYIDDDALQLTRDSWSKYNALYSEVTSLLKDKKELISTYHDTVDSLTDEVKTLLDKIKSYSFDGTAEL